MMADDGEAELTTPVTSNNSYDTGDDSGVMMHDAPQETTTHNNPSQHSKKSKALLLTFDDDDEEETTEDYLYQDASQSTGEHKSPTTIGGTPRSKKRVVPITTSSSVASKESHAARSRNSRYSELINNHNHTSNNSRDTGTGNRSVKSAHGHRSVASGSSSRRSRAASASARGNRSARSPSGTSSASTANDPNAYRHVGVTVMEGSDRTRSESNSSTVSKMLHYPNTPTKVVTDEYYKVMEEKLKHEEIRQKQQQQQSPSAASVGSSHTKTTTSAARGALLGQLPWTESDSDILREQVAYWKNCLVDHEEKMPKEAIRDLLKSLYNVLRQDTISRSDRSLQEISHKLEALKRVNLPTLIDLMNRHEQAGDMMDGEDVILLTGSVGSGKTTTLHFLAGTEFSETEVDGFIHLYPGTIKDPAAQNYKTACGRDAITRGLQVATVKLPDSNKNVVICDTPGFEIPATLEEELAYHYGMSAAVDRAKRVKPVVVLNQELMGSCFANLPHTLQLMTQDLALKTPRDLKALDYVFTHYEERHRSRLCQQFASLKHNKPPRPEKGAKTDLFDDFLNDMIQKTTPKAKLAMPLDDSPEELLNALWKESFVEEPRDYYYRSAASQKTLKQFQLQLQITLEELRTALSREVYSLALNRMLTLDKLSVWFPQAKQAALLGKEAASKQVKLIWDWMADEIANGNYERALFRMEQMSDFGLIFPDAHDCCKHGHDLIWESLVAPMEEKDYMLTMNRIDKLSKLAPHYSEASNCVKRALRLLRKKIENAGEPERFKHGLALLVPLSSMSTEDAPEAAECAKSILASLTDRMESTIARKDYAMALHMIRKFSSLQALYPQAGDLANRGLSLCRQTLDTSVAQGDYDSALFLVQNMQRLQSEFPQAGEIARFGMDVFASSVEVLIQHKHYKKAVALMKKVGAELQGSHECTKKALGAIQTAVESIVRDDKDYDTAFSLMKQVRDEVSEDINVSHKGLGFIGSEIEGLLEDKEYDKALSLITQVTQEVPGSDACTLKGLSVISNEIASLVQSKDYEQAIALINTVRTEVPGPGTDYCIQKGFRVFAGEVERLAENKEYGEAVELLKKLATELEESEECIVEGLALMKLKLRTAVKTKDYEGALQIIYEVNNLAKAVPHPQADACIEYAFNALEEHILVSIDHQEYQSAIHLMELLTVGEDKMPQAKECTRVGIQVLKRNVAKAIEKKKYSPALEMIQQLSDKGHKIPEVGECSRRGLQLLKDTAQTAIVEKDYPTAIEIITNLSELSLTIPEAQVCTLAGLHAIVDHVTELRQDIEKTVEEIGQIRDLKVFVAMLLKLKSQVEKVMKSEQLRKVSVQIHYKKNFRSNEDEAGDATALFVPQLYTSQAFCSDQLELLATKVREKLPEFDVNNACMENLIRNRKGILSVMIRLKATHKILQHCPGGEKATAVYTSTFEQFFALIDTVLAIAEESIKPPIDMRLFELQAWFLSVLIKGFIKDKIDVDSEERRQMEELESRRKIMMLHFEVQITEALELLTDQDFVKAAMEREGSKEEKQAEKTEDDENNSENGDSNGTGDAIGDAKGDGDANGVGEAKDNGDTKDVGDAQGEGDATEKATEPLTTVTAESLAQLDMNLFEGPRKILLSLCLRPELFKMVLKGVSTEDVKTTIMTFDKALIDFIGQMVRFGEVEYNTLLQFARSGASLPEILDRAVILREQTEKIETEIAIARSWDPDWVGETTLSQQRLLILKKRIELATEKLESTIRTETEIGFGAFVSNMARPFLCDGKWYEDVPTSFL